MDLHTIDTSIQQWLKEARAFILSYTDYQIKEKADFRDLVSEVDIEVEKILMHKIQSFPEKQVILAEEQTNEELDLNATHLWVMDPIDGTANFLKQKRDYGIMLAYFQSGEPKLSYLYDINADDLYHAMAGEGVFLNGKSIEKPLVKKLNTSLIAIDAQRTYKTAYFQYCENYAFDLRFMGSTLADSIRVINGNFGATINDSSDPWDRAPLILFAKELGLVMTQFSGQPHSLLGEESYYFGSKIIFDELYKSFNP